MMKQSVIEPWRTRYVRSRVALRVLEQNDVLPTPSFDDCSCCSFFLMRGIKAVRGLFRGHVITRFQVV